MRFYIVAAILLYLGSVSLAQYAPQEHGDANALRSLKKRSASFNEVDHLLSHEDELNSVLQDDFSGTSSSEKAKRSPFTVDFMGMRVSYPQYLRLTALQEKVIKLDKLIRALQAKYSAEQLASLPQYARLQTLHQSLTPLLPEVLQNPSKRSPFSVDFMGMQVSYPQYLRLVALQEKVIQLDKLLRKMKMLKSEKELAKIPQWQRLVSLHGSLKKLLPADYLAEKLQTDEVFVEPVRPIKRSTMDFNGVQVSLPQYLRLKALQDKVLKLDLVMRKLSKGVDPEKLAASAKWNQLVTMRQTLQKLLPDEHPTFEKRGMEFNGVQVSYPQYFHLLSLRKKVMALDTLLKRIEESGEFPNLEENANWTKLINMRNSLSKLMPQETDQTTL